VTRGYLNLGLMKRIRVQTLPERMIKQERYENVHHAVHCERRWFGHLPLVRRRAVISAHNGCAGSPRCAPAVSNFNCLRK
jgi:hypothetical protein